MQEWQIRKTDGEVLRVRSPYVCITREDGPIDIVRPADGKKPEKVVRTLAHGEWGSITDAYDPTPKVMTFSEGG